MKKENITDKLKNKIKEVSHGYLKTEGKIKRKLLRELFEKIIVIDEYEIKLVFKQTSNSGALLFDVILYRRKYKYEDIEELKRLYIKKGMSLRQIADKFNCSRSTIYKK